MKLINQIYCRSAILRLIFIFLFIVFVNNSLSAQSIIYVKQSASGNNDGSTWTDAYTNLQSALNVANSGDSIWVSEGIYKPSVDKLGNPSPSDSRTKTLLMIDGVTLVGGFYGDETNFNQRDFENHETILSGDLGIANDTSDNAYHIITGVDNYNINGFTLTKGSATSSENNQYFGGGIHNNGVSNINIECCKFENNYAFGGAAIGNYYCTAPIEITNCWFIADTTNNLVNNSGEGGAIANWNSAPVITNCIFVDNYAYTYGGALYNWGSGSNGQITNSVFYNNETNTTGGALHNRGASSVVVNSVLWNNNSDDFTGTNGGNITINYSCIEDVSGYSGSNNTNADPLFFDAENYDFNFQSGSPCLDAANGDEAPEFDIYGNARYDMLDVVDSGTGTITYVDMGAVECQGYPEISGHVTQDTTWTHSWIQITGNLTVDAGATLTINPGTKVDFNGYYKLIVEGVILAEGTETDSIIFTTDDPATGYHGIRFESNSSTDSSKFSYCKFEYGKATGASYEATGGAIYSNGFDLISIENCSFYNNSATGGGAIYLRNAASPVIINNKFINNDGGNYFGGAVTIEAGSNAKIINNLFSNNTSRDGGAVGIFSNIEFTNNSIVNNSATSNGGGICIYGTNTTVIKNCIIYGNVGVNGNQVYLQDDNSDPDFDNCDIEGGSGSFHVNTGSYTGTLTNCIDSDPVFTDPNAGTGNQSDALTSDWTLQSTSPCINSGLSDTTGLSLPSYDILGNFRVINDIIDMGAFEADVIPACGNVSSNTLWNADTVKVNCDITIDDTYTLTINPGTVVEFQDYYSITVNGCLKAEGTALDSIRFTVADTTGFTDTSIVDGGWAGIIFNNTAITNDTSKFYYCHFEFGKACTDGGSTDGGAIKITNCSKIEITNSYFVNNWASGSYAGAGAIDISTSSNPVISNSIFYKNVAKGPYFNGGGAINISESDPQIFNCQFYNNVADSSSGGAIYVRDNADPQIINNVFANNYARYGGAMLFAATANPSIYNNTIAFNDSKFGGGLTFYENSNPDIKNNILYANTDSAGGAQVFIYDNASQPDFSYNDIEGGSAGFDMPDTVNYIGNYANNIDEDPLFANPSAGAGISYDGKEAEWNLMEDNPCINAGTPDTTGLNIPTKDLINNLRIHNSVRIDIGAYEYLNNHPEINAQSFNVDENATNSSAVGTCLASDVDGDGYGFSIISGNTNNAFAIDINGNITVNNSSELDYETVPDQEFELIIQAEDDGIGTLVDTAIITINLIDVNDAPTIDPFVFDLDENSINTTLIGTISGNDEDSPAQTLTYSITGGTYAANFDIDASSGELTVLDSTPLDYETNPSINITVQVQDDGTGNLTGSNTVTINLNDVNDNPLIVNQEFSVDEQSVATTPIGTVLANDVDLPAQDLSYAIIAGNDNNAFAIVPASGELQVNIKDSVDFELATSQVITVEVTDNGPGNLSNSADITININNINDNAPVFNDTTVSFSESSSETDLIVEFISSDIDNLEALTYSFISGNESNIFYLSNGNSNRLYLTSNGFQNYLNYEEYSSFDLVMAVTDGDSVTEADVTINISDVNEYPTLDEFEFSVDENANNGVSVGTIAGTDPDFGQNLYYFIHTGTFNNVTPFAIDSVTGEITVNDSIILDYEGNYQSFHLSMRMRDDGIPNLTVYTNVTIAMNDVNEAPVVDPQTFSLFENTSLNSTIGTVLASHQDAGQNLAYSFVSGNENGIFSLNDSNGIIMVAKPDSLNYEAKQTYQLIIEVKDNSEEQLSDTALITINLQDVNEPPVLTDYEFTIDENTSFNTVIGTVLADDPDETGWVVYYFEMDNLYPPFYVENSTGEVKVHASDSIDYEYRTQFVYTLVAQDQNYLKGYSTVTINLNDVNEAPTIPHKDFYIDENLPENTIVGLVDAVTDAGETVEFSITGGNYYGVFGINSSTGEIFVADEDSLNYELLNYYDLTVRATDNSTENYWGENVITIYINNVNDAPILNAQIFYYLGDPNINPYVGHVVASDDDQDMLNYYIEDGNANDAFMLNQSTGELSVQNPAEINPSVTPEYNIRIRVEDYELFDTAMVKIKLTPNSVSDNLIDGLITIYPNPTTDYINVSFNQSTSKIDISVIDELNHVVYRNNMDNVSKDFIQTIDLKDLAKGLYFIKIQLENESYFKRIVME